MCYWCRKKNQLLADETCYYHPNISSFFVRKMFYSSKTTAVFINQKTVHHTFYLCVVTTHLLSINLRMHGQQLLIKEK